MRKTYVHLTPQQRAIIDLGNMLGKPVAEIARLIGRHRSTVYRELRRNTDPNAGYTDMLGCQLYTWRRLKGGPKRKIRGRLKTYITQKLSEQWSPEQIVGRSRREGRPLVSVETIYRFIYEDRKKGGALWRNLRLCHPKRRRRFPRHRWRTLRPCLENRPSEANQRLKLGHFERDLIEGPRQGGGSLLVITDRRSRLTFIQRPDRKTASAVHRATLDALKGQLVRSLTNDNGSEFKRFQNTSRRLKAPIYFTRPYASWERGTVENTNGLIRQYFHKGLRLKEIPDAFIHEVAKKLNERPRKTLGFLTPIEFEAREKESC